MEIKRLAEWILETLPRKKRMRKDAGAHAWRIAIQRYLESKEYIRLCRDGQKLHKSKDDSRVHSVLQTVPALPDRLSLKADPPASVNLIYDSEILICNQNFPCYLTLILTEYNAMLHHIDCQFINMEKVSPVFYRKQNHLFPHMTAGRWNKMSNALKIFDNAIDSIELGIADYLLIPTDKRRAISAVRNIFAGILLLFKSKLAELSKNDDEALIKQRILPKIDGTHIKWIGKGEKTVDVQQIKERFKSLGINVDWNCLNEIQQYRNNIEHYFDVKNTKAEVIGQYITKSFIVICCFIRDYFDNDPKEYFSPEVWKVFIAEQTVYEAELKEVHESLDLLHWYDPELLSIFKGLLCPQCASFLIMPTERNKEAHESRFQCRSCSSEWEYDDLADIICDSMNTHNHNELEDSIAYCPECMEESYSTELHLCLKCGVHGPFICSRCEDIVPASELISYEETGMCGYCTHMVEGIMEDDAE